jgi:hypothetical protein
MAVFVVGEVVTIRFAPAILLPPEQSLIGAAAAYVARTIADIKSFIVNCYMRSDSRVEDE